MERSGLPVIRSSIHLIACLAQLINVIAPITTVKGGGSFKQATYYPFELLSRYGRGKAIRPAMETETFQSIYGETNLVQTAVIYDEKADEVHVFAINCDEAEDVELALQLQGFGDRKLVKHLAVYGDRLEEINTIDDPDRVVTKEIAVTDASKALLPKASFNVLILK